jgi:hypothetical protein
MDVHAWKTPIRAVWHKSNTLLDIHYTRDGVEVIIDEDETHQHWVVAFKDLVALKVIVGDNAHWSLAPIPPDGGFFQITDSPWLTALGLTETNDQQIPHHYVICCKRELIEVAAFHATFTAK